MAPLNCLTDPAATATGWLARDLVENEMSWVGYGITAAGALIIAGLVERGVHAYSRRNSGSDNHNDES